MKPNQRLDRSNIPWDLLFQNIAEATGLLGEAGLIEELDALSQA